MEAWSKVFAQMKLLAIEARERGHRYMNMSKSASGRLEGRHAAPRSRLQPRSLQARERIVGGALPLGLPKSADTMRDALFVSRSIKLVRSASGDRQSARFQSARGSPRASSSRTSPDTPGGFKSARGDAMPLMPKSTTLEASKAYYVATAMQVLLALFPYAATGAMTADASDMYWVFASSAPDPTKPLLENLTARLKRGLLDSVVRSTARKLPVGLQTWALEKYAEVKAGL